MTSSTKSSKTKDKTETLHSSLPLSTITLSFETMTSSTTKSKKTSKTKAHTTITSTNFPIVGGPSPPSECAYSTATINGYNITLTSPCPTTTSSGATTTSAIPAPAASCYPLFNIQYVGSVWNGLCAVLVPWGGTDPSKFKISSTPCTENPTAFSLDPMYNQLYAVGIPVFDALLMSFPDNEETATFPSFDSIGNILNEDGTYGLQIYGGVYFFNTSGSYLTTHWSIYYSGTFAELFMTLTPFSDPGNEFALAPVQFEMINPGCSAPPGYWTVGYYPENFVLAIANLNTFTPTGYVTILGDLLLGSTTDPLKAARWNLTNSQLISPDNQNLNFALGMTTPGSSWTTAYLTGVGNQTMNCPLSASGPGTRLLVGCTIGGRYFDWAWDPILQKLGVADNSPDAAALGWQVVSIWPMSIAPTPI